MTDTDGDGRSRDVVVTLETESSQVAQVSVAAAAKAAENKDIAAVMGEVATTIVNANFRMRRSLRFSGDDAHWLLATVDYLTRPQERQPQPTGQKQRQN
jgi:hypothetical protein